MRRTYRPSTGFLVSIVVVFSLIVAFLALALTGGCDAATGGVCHGGYGIALAAALAIDLLALGVLVERALRPRR